MSLPGYILVHRSVWASENFNDEPFSEREAWLWMVSEACWKDTSVRANNKPVKLERGQFTHSVRFMAERWKWSKSKTDRFLARLKTETLIGTDSGTGQLIVTICNYSKYQDAECASGTRSGTECGTAAGHSRDSSGTEKNKTNTPNTPNTFNTPLIDPPLTEQLTGPSNDGPDEKEKPDGRKQSKRGTRLEADWDPNEKTWDFAADLLGSARVQQVLDEFRDYWIAVPGQRGVKLDWNATFRNWCRRASEQATGPYPGKPTKSPGNQQPTASWTQASRNVLERLERANGGKGTGEGVEQGPCTDHEAEGGYSGHGTDDPSIFGEVIPLSGGHRKARS